jgi:hypothetical protein
MILKNQIEYNTPTNDNISKIIFVFKGMCLPKFWYFLINLYPINITGFYGGLEKNVIYFSSTIDVSILVVRLVFLLRPNLNMGSRTVLTLGFKLVRATQPSKKMRYLPVQLDRFFLGLKIV